VHADILVQVPCTCLPKPLFFFSYRTVLGVRGRTGEPGEDVVDIAADRLICGHASTKSIFWG